MQEKWSCDIKYPQVIEKDTMVFTPPQAKCNNKLYFPLYVSLCLTTLHSRHPSLRDTPSRAFAPLAAGNHLLMYSFHSTGCLF